MSEGASAQRRRNAYDFRTVYSRPTPKGTMEHHCARCERYLPAKKFFPSSIRLQIRRCKHCLVDERRIRRQNARKLKKTEQLAKKLMHYDNSSGKLPTTRDAVVLVELVFDHHSTMTGLPIGGAKNITLVPFDATRPLSLGNVALVTVEEGRALRMKRFAENDLRMEPTNE